MRSGSSIFTRNLACRYRRSRPYYRMPRDLFTSDSRDESIVQSPLSQTPKADQQFIGKDDDFGSLPIELQRNESRELRRQPGNGRMNANEKNNLHPYVQTLSISNLESCVALENAIFPEPERCSREKVRIYRQSFISFILSSKISLASTSSCAAVFISMSTDPQLVFNNSGEHCICASFAFPENMGMPPFVGKETNLLAFCLYCTSTEPGSRTYPPFGSSRSQQSQFIYRLTKCPELCLGLFSTTTSPSANDVPTFDSAHAPNSSTPNLKSVLIAMIIGTKTRAPAVTDECMENPPNWQSQRPNPQDLRGHQEHGQTICVQTLGVLPAYQGRGLAKILMKSYQQRMETSGIAQRIALLAHEYLVRMYEGMGFVNKGRSPVKFGGGGWTSLVSFPN